VKIFLTQQPDQRSSEDNMPGNEILRLSAEMWEGNGVCPMIDVRGARLDHWNGHKISIARTELSELLDRGLIADDGHWTDLGRRELARYAGVEALDALDLPASKR
jgi:hypothetical protein